jgi:8-oxo-dGTP diphosphatase
MLTADVAAFALVDGELSTLLIRRRRDPFAGRWAFPGGFVDENEPPEAAARRELWEEAGVRVKSLELFGVYGDPGRDPRGWTVTASYMALLDSRATQASAGDDAAEVAWRPVARPPNLAFDHERMLADAWRALRGMLYRTDLASVVLGEDAVEIWELERAYRRLDPAAPQGRRLVRLLLVNGVIERRGSSTWAFRRPK